MDGVMAFSQWQADGTGIDVVMEPLPADLPDEIMMDEKWLKDDLLCLASNAVKYSRSNQGVPAVLRVAIVPSPTEGKANVPSPPLVQFTFIDSGYPLSDERITTIFNRPVHSERIQTGGMGLGLFCLREHMQALQGQYGVRRRSDGREGIEIWFSFPLIVPEADQDQFVMNDMGHGTHGSNVHHQRSLLNKEDVSMNTAAVNNKMTLTSVIVDKPLFSSPQNRRSSMMRYSQKSHHSSLLDQSIRSARDMNSNITSIVSIRGLPVDSSARGGAVVADAGGGNFDALRVADPSTRDSRKAVLSTRTSADRIQEVLGVLPILLVDDSVSILKMTKRAIQNECANIRSAIFQHFCLLPLSYVLSHTPYQHITATYQLYGGQERRRSF